ncbi:regulator of microtubule dynamics protein 2 isoform X2 [Chiloscyllium plagiosum]|uniref:regulator of microtubule dynamics protein 2 isoform X2 n=1 Tax=Chiloscyllium plagiosum TaxID=36176 RepID=UPI001CB87480|nr:regulator of microtubule dynamics protein 2 isoform X2 [Chiloscyllium plagiosum]
MTQSTDGKALVLGLLAGVGIGAAGLTLAVAWYRRTKENESSISAARSRVEFRNRLKASGPRIPSPRQADILETLSELIRSLEEVKDEVQSLKEAVPRLEERVRKELSELGPERSPRKAARKRKRSERVLEDGDGDVDVSAVGFGSVSSEEVESEGGYITAHTDTEEESEEEKVICSTFGSPLQEDSQAREFNVLIQKADNLHDNPELDKEEGFQLLLGKKDQFWDQVEFLWRLARAYADMHDIAVDVEDKKNYAVIGKEIAMDAVKLGPQNADSHMWLAIVCGHLSEYGSVQSKIKNGTLFKDHIDKAIELRPQDPKLYHLLGRWCYAASKLSWLEKKVAATLFDEPPNSTIQEALQCFLKVEELHPRYSKTNCVYITKCYRELGQTNNAQMWCDTAASFPYNAKPNHIETNAYTSSAILTEQGMQLGSVIFHKGLNQKMLQTPNSVRGEKNTGWMYQLNTYRQNNKICCCYFRFPTFGFASCFSIKIIGL